MAGVSNATLTGAIAVADDTYELDDALIRAAFEIEASAVLALGGTTSILSSDFDGPGLTRSLDDDTLSDVGVGAGATFVNTGAVMQSGEVRDAGLIRDIGTWTLGADDEIEATDSSASFVNLGLFDATGPATSTNAVSANFYDYADLELGGTLAFSGSQTVINLEGVEFEAGQTAPGTISILAGDARFVNEPPSDETASSSPARGGGHSGGGGAGGGHFQHVEGLAVEVAGGARAVFVDGPDPDVDASYVGDLTVEAGGVVAIGAGETVESATGSTTTVDGAIRGAGSFVGAANVDAHDGARLLGVLNVDSIVVSGRVVAGAADVDFTVQTVQLNEGRLLLSGLSEIDAASGAGQIVNQNILQMRGVNFDATLTGDVTLVNNSLLKLGLDTPFADDTLDASASIVNHAGAAMLLGASTLFSLNGGTVFNQGQIVMDSLTSSTNGFPYGTGVVSSFVQNDGEILSGAGLEFKNAVEGTGLDKITAVDLEGTFLVGTQQAGLTFDAAVGADQTVVFYNAHQSLSLNDVADFAATVSEFDQKGLDDAIIINSPTNGAFGDWRFDGFAENANGAGGVLSFSGGVDGSSTASVSLAGSYEASGFTATQIDASLQITYKPS